MITPELRSNRDAFPRASCRHSVRLIQSRISVSCSVRDLNTHETEAGDFRGVGISFRGSYVG